MAATKKNSNKKIKKNVPRNNESDANSKEIEGGLLELSEFVIPEGQTVTVAKNLEIRSLGRIVIDGELVSADVRESNGTNEPGISICLIAVDDVVVRGRIATGSGAHGRDDGKEYEAEIAVADSGMNGGDITIISKQGSIILERNAALSTGGGGNGGAAQAKGHTPQYLGGKGGHAVAVAGNGGHGGSIHLSANDWISVDPRKGMFDLGNGGAGGNAQAKGGNGGNADRSTLPGVGGGVYCKAGDAGHSGWMPREVMLAITRMGDNNQAQAIGARALRNLFTGGRGGKPGRSRATGGKSGKPFKEKTERQ